MVKHLKVKIADKLSEAEWRVLKAFCDRAMQLAKTKLVTGGTSGINAKMHFEQDKGLRFAATLPPEEQLAEFLMVFRFFYLQKEKTHFFKILAILGKHTVQDEVRRHLKMLRDKWNHALFANALKITLNDKPLSASLLLDLWFNAHYFHSDESKQNELETIKNFFTENFAKFMLIDSVYESAGLIFQISDGLQGLFTERKSISNS